MLKEKLGICLYEENYYKEKIIKIQGEKPIKVIGKVSNKKSTKKLIDESDNDSIKEISKVSNKKSTKKLIEESDNESIKELDNESIEKIEKESTKEINKESEEEFIEDLKEPFSLNNKGTTNWYDKNKFKKILTTIGNNNFNHKNKIGKFKFNDINNLINNIKNDTISEADIKKRINKLNQIKKVEIKGKRLIKSQEKLLSLFDDLKTFFNDNNNNTNNVNANKNENESVDKC